MFQVHANQVELFLGDSGLWRLLDLLALQDLPLSVFDRLIVERFRLFLLEKPLRRLHNRRRDPGVILDRNETEAVRPLTPVEYMSITFGLAPVDKRLSGGAGSWGRRWGVSPLGHRC